MTRRRPPTTRSVREALRLWRLLGAPPDTKRKPQAEGESGEGRGDENNKIITQYPLAWWRR